jgi:Flp pilus assembly protein TadG
MTTMRKIGLPRVVAAPASARVGETPDRRRPVSGRSAELVRRPGFLSRTVSIWSDESGVVAVIVALVATLVVAIVGLGIDVVD